MLFLNCLEIWHNENLQVFLSCEKFEKFILSPKTTFLRHLHVVDIHFFSI